MLVIGHVIPTENTLEKAFTENMDSPSARSLLIADAGGLMNTLKKFKKLPLLKFRQ